MSLSWGELVFKAGIIVLLILADLWMFNNLISGLEKGELSPAIAAVLSSLTTAITGILALAGKDFFNASNGSRT